MSVFLPFVIFVAVIVLMFVGASRLEEKLTRTKARFFKVVELNSGEQQREIRKHHRENEYIKEKNHLWHSPIGVVGEDHVDRVGNTPVKHEQPEAGYVILNGKKYKISEVKKL